jgi:hypothetical protein
LHIPFPLHQQKPHHRWCYKNHSRYTWENNSLFFYPNIVKEAVNLYNTWPHKAFDCEFSPTDAQSYKPFKERNITYKAEDIQKKQAAANFISCKPHNIFLIHLNTSKTDIPRATKKYNIFSKLAEFIGYDHGNVCCKVLEK